MVKLASQPAVDRAPGLNLVGLTNPFSLADRLEVTLPAGGTVVELLAEAGVAPPDGITALVFIDDWEIPRRLWHRVRPRPGRLVTVRLVPAGGGGGGKKNPLRLVLSIVIMVVAAVLTAGYGAALGAAMGFSGATAAAVGGGIISGVVGIAGSLLTAALIPPPSRPSLGSLRTDGFGGSAAASPTYSLVGATNDYRHYQPIPALLGRHKVTPPYAAKWFTSLSGNDHILHLLFTIGQGPLEVTDHKLGDTPAEEYEGVKIEVREGRSDDPPPTLFPFDADGQRHQIELTVADGWRRLTAPRDADELGVEITCPRLATFDDTGARAAATVRLAIRWSPEGQETWTDEPDLVIRDNQTNAVRREHKWLVPRGTYDIEVRRLTADASDRVQSETWWTALQTWRHEPPVALKGLCLVALEMLASGNLSGQHPPYSCVATRIAPDWDATWQTWVERPTRSPAAMYRYVLQGAATRRPATDADLDLDWLADWSEDCAAGGWTCDIVYDFASTLREVLIDVAATGRAKPHRDDAGWSVVRDRPQTAPAAVITPRNSFGFEAKHSYVDHPHALIVWFLNEEKGWERDFVVVYDDGYDEATATRFEELDLFGITHPDQAWKQGRFAMAVARLRPAEYRVAQDVEYLTAPRGAWVDLAHDVISVGLAYGRIRRVLLDPQAEPGQEITGLELDEQVTQEAGKTYAVVVSSGAEAARTLTLATAAGTSRTVTFASPQDQVLVDQDVIAKGHLVTFGEAGRETIPCVVRDIEPGPHLSARLTLLDLAPDVHDADQGPIPAYDSGMTKPAAAYPARPAAPVITGLVSDETVLLPAPGGGWQPQLVVQLEPRTGDTVPIARTQAQIRAAGGQDWTWLPDLPGDALEVSSTAVEQGQAYAVRVRAVTGPTAQHPGNLTSPWATAPEHTVIGKTTLPPVPTDLVRENDRAVWRYPEKPRDFLGFEVRAAAGVTDVVDAATPLHDGVVTATDWDLRPLLGGGPRTLFVRAFDTDGNASATVARMVLDLGDPAIVNVVEEVPQAPGWPGTLTGGAVVDGELRADGQTTWWTGTDAAVLWTGVDTHEIWAPLHVPMAYEWDYAAPEAAQLTVVLDLDGPQGWTLDYRRRLTTEAWSGSDAATWWTGSDAATRWQGADGPWRAWPGALAAERSAYAFRLSIAGGAGRGIVRAATARLDVPDESETVQDVALAPGGTRVPLARRYRAIRQVTPTLQGGSTAFVVVVQDREPAGPLLEALDRDNVSVAANVDVTIRGVKAAA